MDFIKRDMSKTEVQNGNSTKMREAENGWMKAKKAIDDAVYELGKAYFEANKENKESEFAEQMEAINKRKKEEYLWHQYRLKLDGQRMCDSCKSFITVDSAFCNRCGASVTPIDFSSILGTANDTQGTGNSDPEPKCPKCGRKLIEGAMFCEGCGTKIV